MEFMAWPSIARLNREMIVTEKIDGTNSAVIIEHLGVYTEAKSAIFIATHQDDYVTHVTRPAVLEGPEVVEWPGMVEIFEVGAQSRKRLICPVDDNFGFAQWVWDNAENLVKALGEGRHYGEWWGSGVQRGYGLDKGEKRFSLFNVKRWEGVDFATFDLPNVACVPVMYRGNFSQAMINLCLDDLRKSGSWASEKFMNPEGIVVFHKAANQLFKVTLENDEVPKSVAASQAVSA